MSPTLPCMIYPSFWKSRETHAWEGNFYLIKIILSSFNKNIFKLQFPNIQFKQTAVVVTSASTAAKSRNKILSKQALCVVYKFISGRLVGMLPLVP